MSTENQAIDGLEGLEKEIAKRSTVQRSQCGTCIFKVGTHACQKFGKRPYKYASVLAGVDCPKRKEK